MAEEKLSKKERRRLKKLKKQEEKFKATQTAWLKRVSSWVLAGAVVLGIGYLISSQVVVIPEVEKDKPVDRVLASDWVMGNPEAPIVLMEYSDFSCPACASYVEVLKSLAATFGEEVVIVFRHFPLRQIHPRSELAAQAAEAAGKQGKFWEMEELLYEKQAEWSESVNTKALFAGYAEEIGLNVIQFRKDLSSKEVKALVKADYFSGLAERINSTPTFFLNGEKIVNPNSLQSFEDLIISQLPSTASAQLETQE